MAYQLEKYTTAKSRFDCPSCGQHRTFARYADEAGNHLADDVGRCNRESKCGYHKTPKEYFAEHPQAVTIRQSQPRAAFKQMAQPKPEAFSVIDQKYLDASLKDYDRNNFIKFLLTLFERATVEELIARFRIGTNNEGQTVFWQIDEQGCIRSGKIIAYAIDGKRIKPGDSDRPAIAWVHRRLRLADFQLDQCLFGAQQLPAELGKTVAIVEAEKTAIIASALMPEFVWLASGGKQNLKPEKFQPLKQRRVILFPDADGFCEWSKNAQALRLCCADLTVNELLETSLSDEEKREGLDIADFLIAEEHGYGIFSNALCELSSVAQAENHPDLWMPNAREDANL